MNENIIRTINSEMNRYLNNYQIYKLQEVLYKKIEIVKDEMLERLRNRCTNIRNLAIIDLLASSSIRIS